MKTISPLEFAVNHDTDPDWVSAMVDNNMQAVVWHRGDRVTYSGFPATVIRHAVNGMYEIMLRRGGTCVDGCHLIPMK